MTTSIAISVCVWNALVGGWEDFGGVMHDPVITESWAVKVGLPMTPFTILNSSLGLLLGELYIYDTCYVFSCCKMYIIHIICSYLMFLHYSYLSSSLHELHII